MDADTQTLFFPAKGILRIAVLFRLVFIFLVLLGVFHVIIAGFFHIHVGFFYVDVVPVTVVV